MPFSSGAACMKEARAFHRTNPKRSAVTAEPVILLGKTGWDHRCEEARRPASRAFQPVSSSLVLEVPKVIDGAGVAVIVLQSSEAKPTWEPVGEHCASGIESV